MNYVSAKFYGIRTTDEDIAKILIEISGFEGKGTLRRIADTSRVVSKFFSKNTDWHLDNPDFVITSILTNGKPDSGCDRTIEYNPEIISPIYISALEERLNREKKL